MKRGLATALVIAGLAFVLLASIEVRHPAAISPSVRAAANTIGPSTSFDGYGAGDALGMGIILILGLLLYFLPSIIGKNKRNSGAILAVNFFLGWTFVGWVLALVWALMKDEEGARVIVNQTPTAAVLCSSCGKYSVAGAQFCPHCGGGFATRIAASEARPEN
jgi:hypothetical protein